jgi:DNA repair protein RecN (Recombination protein N)
MLAVKYCLAGKTQLPTLLFDEIDTGISGEAAKQVGLLMQQLSAKHQVICITHQAQIAAKANAHYYIYKATDKGINTQVKTLTSNERVEVLAKMMSGEQPSAAALENARQLMS